MGKFVAFIPARLLIDQCHRTRNCAFKVVSEHQSFARFEQYAVFPVPHAMT